jgi:HEAT repeat protein
MSTELNQEEIEYLLQICQGDDENAIVDAVMNLEEHNIVESVPVLLPLLSSSSRLVRNVTVDALGQVAPIGDPSVSNSIIALLQDEDDLVRAVSAEALGLLEYGGATTSLITSLHNDSDELVRVCAAESLALLFNYAPDEISAALIVALEDTDGLVRGYAADGLTHDEPTRALPAIQSQLDQEHNPYYQAWLLQAMVQLGETSKLPTLLDTLRIDQTEYEDPDGIWLILFGVMQSFLRKIISSDNRHLITQQLETIGNEHPYLSESMEILISRLSDP